MTTPIEPGPQTPLPQQPVPHQPSGGYPPPAPQPSGPYPAQPGAYQVPPGYPMAGQPIPVVAVPTSPTGRPLAEFVDRFLAHLIDSAIIGGVSLVVIVPLYVCALFTLIPTQVTYNSQPVNPGAEVTSVMLIFFGVFGLILGLSALIGYIYYVEMAWRTGQTVGKRVMKLQIIPLDPAQPLTRGMMTKRFAATFGIAFVPGLAWVDGLWQLWDKPYRQCLHDKFATTVVIKLMA